jgi:hypothetical protein
VFSNSVLTLSFTGEKTIHESFESHPKDESIIDAENSLGMGSAGREFFLDDRPEKDLADILCAPECVLKKGP